MARLPRVSGQEMLQFLRREGFTVVRIRGSHHFLNRGHVDTVIPVHGSRTLKTGTLRTILRDIDLTPAEFEQRLKA